MTILTNSYFSGAGLIDIGLSQGGLTIQQSFEIDAKCCETQRRNFSHEVVEGDITRKLALTDKACDVAFGTYPCTRYAPSADIHGVRTGDELYLHFFRQIALTRPEVFGLENVPGMRKFPVVMEAMTRLPDYYVTAFCPVDAELWLPQRRPRLIILGSKRRFEWRAPEVSGRRVRLAEIVEDEPEVEIPDYVARRIKGKYRDKPIISDPAKDDIAPLCVAHYAKDLSTRMVVDPRYKHGVRPYSLREYARLQGVPDSFEFCGGVRDGYRMVGNGVAIPVGEWVGREITRYFQHSSS